MIRSSDLVGRLRSFDRAAAPEWRVRVLSMGLRHAGVEWEEAGARREGFKKLGDWLRETLRSSPVPALRMPGAAEDADLPLPKESYGDAFRAASGWVQVGRVMQLDLA